MSWYRIVFNPNTETPDGNYEGNFLGEANRIYQEAGEPAGLGVFEIFRPNDSLHAYYFSPIAAEHCKALIESHSGSAWGKPPPEDAEWVLGHENARGS